MRYQVLGSLGKYVKYGLDPQEDRLKAGERPTHPQWSQEMPEQYGILYHAEGMKTSSLSLGAISTISHKWLRQSEMVHPIP